MWCTVVNTCTCLHALQNISLTLPQGIGDSGQGMANGVLFVLLTKNIRINVLKMCCRKPADRDDIQSSVNPISDDEA